MNVGKKYKTYNVDEDVPDQVSEPLMLYAIRQHTFTSSQITALKQLSGLGDDALATALNMNIKTFRSYKLSELPLKPLMQEHVIAMLALYKHGLEVFDTSKSLNAWLDKANFYFDNDKPINFLTTISGIKFVDDRLTAIQYGDNV